MKYGTGAEGSSSEVQWWKANRSASEIADRLARSVAGKQDVEHRLATLTVENRELKLRCTAASAELAEVRLRLTAEHSKFRSQRAALEDVNVGGRRKAESAARDRLVKDELERKIQMLQVELNKARQHVERLKAKMAGCICGEIRIEHVGPTHTPNSGVPERWLIRNSR